VTGAKLRQIHGVVAQAIELAAPARENGNPPFGSLLAGPAGEILAEEPNTSITEGDITAHPELKLAGCSGAGSGTGASARRVATACRGMRANWSGWGKCEYVKT
jgi:hypothetical protein